MRGHGGMSQCTFSKPLWQTTMEGDFADSIPESLI
ncbi:unnamed protein product [Prunus brigantina]